MQKIFRKKTSICKEICFSNAISVAVIVGITIAVITSIGIRTCYFGQYKDGANCVLCSKTLGD